MESRAALVGVALHSHESNSKHSKASNGLRMVNLRREKGKDESSKMPNINYESQVKSERSKGVNVNGRAKVDGSLKSGQST